MNLQICVFLRPDPRVGRADLRVGKPDRWVRPAGRRYDKGPPAGRWECEKGESAGQIRGFEPDTRVMVARPASDA